MPDSLVLICIYNVCTILNYPVIPDSWNGSFLWGQKVRNLDFTCVSSVEKVDFGVLNVGEMGSFFGEGEG